MEIFSIQEFCPRDDNDCRECNGALYHLNSSFATYEAAVQGIKKNLLDLMQVEIEGLSEEEVVFDNEHCDDYEQWTAKARDVVSQWYYQLYIEKPCEQCYEFTLKGHIH